MRTFVLLVTMLGWSAVPATAQPPLPTGPPDPPGRIITVRGYLDGALLATTDMPPSSSIGLDSAVNDRYRVVADQELQHLIDDYQGHEVNVTGRVEDQDDSSARGAIDREVRPGTRVWIGGGRQPAVRLDPIPTAVQTEVPELELRSMRPVNPHCRVMDADPSPTR